MLVARDVAKVRKLYHTWRLEFMWSKDEFLCIFHDKMDHVKIALPRL